MGCSVRSLVVTNGMPKVCTRFRTVVFIVRISKTCSLEDGLSAQHTLLSRPHASWRQRHISVRPSVWPPILRRKNNIFTLAISSQKALCQSFSRNFLNLGNIFLNWHYKMKETSCSTQN